MLCLNHTGFGQANRTDSLLSTINSIPNNYYDKIGKKANQYSKRIVTKTEKTLRKLSHWESRVKKTLDKLNPQLSLQLFADNKLTFKKMHEDYLRLNVKADVMQEQIKNYNKYRDELTTGIKFLSRYQTHTDSSKIIKVITVQADIQKMNREAICQTELEIQIKKRQKELLRQLKGNLKSVLLKKLNKQTYYYCETIKNYREILSNPSKIESLVTAVLKNIPEFNSFFSSASLHSALFRNGQNPVDLSNVGTLQTRAALDQFLAQNPMSGKQVDLTKLLNQGANTQISLLNEIKQRAAKITNAPGGTKDEGKFKPNNQKSKLFRQRLLYDYNIQWERQNQYYPTTAIVGISIGYKLNDLGAIGVGIDYRGGIGSIEKLSFSHQGLSLRSYIDWKVLKSFSVYGGSEWVVSKPGSNTKLNLNSWQCNGSLGLKKQITKSGKGKKKGFIILSYDLYQSQPIPQSSRFKIRYGFNLN